MRKGKSIDRNKRRKEKCFESSAQVKSTKWILTMNKNIDRKCKPLIDIDRFIGADEDIDIDTYVDIDTVI